MGPPDDSTRLARRTPLSRLIDRIDAMSVMSTIGLALALGVVVAVLDAGTGAELSFAIFYVGPVALVAWRLGRAPGLAAATIAALTWYLIDRVTNDYVMAPLVAMWNGAVRFGFFVIISTMTAALRSIIVDAAKEARLDELTGVLNRRGFVERATIEIDRARRLERPLTLAFIDLDDFKSINDTEGHAAGDAVLAHVGSVTRGSLRTIDVVGRLGGDEFALLLPDTTETEAALLLTRLGTAMGSCSGRSVRFSVGAVALGNPPMAIEAALQQADAVMYRSKRSRRDSVRPSSVRGAS